MENMGIRVEHMYMMQKAKCLLSVAKIFEGRQDRPPPYRKMSSHTGIVCKKHCTDHMRTITEFVETSRADTNDIGNRAQWT